MTRGITSFDSGKQTEASSSCPSAWVEPKLEEEWETKFNKKFGFPQK